MMSSSLEWTKDRTELNEVAQREEPRRPIINMQIAREHPLFGDPPILDSQLGFYRVADGQCQVPAEVSRQIA